MTLIKYVLILISAVTLSQAQSPYPDSNSMDKYTVFGFSQHWNITAIDTQILHTTPDLIIRGWSKWDIWGTKPTDFNSSVVSTYHQVNTNFMGGVTASAYFFDEAADSAQFKDMVTRDASNNLVPHDAISQGAYRGNIANPAYRDYVVKMAKLQIDVGADGIHFDEAINSYDGATWNGNEGFDDYTIKDFNVYLAAKYPDYTKDDWISKFKMTDSNYINTSRPLDNLDSNFNYRKYLKAHNWQNNPLTTSNPLSKEWGKVLDGRADTTSNTFLSKYTTMYWKDIVTKTRQYASTTYGKEILITSNGLLPYVDFQSLGMYNYNQDDNGSEAKYVPVTSGHLDGSVSLQSVYRSLYQKSRTIAGSAPVVLFIDWPTDMMTSYYNLPLSEKEDYWKIYAAESYANGIFLAFHLRTSMTNDPTAADQGILDFLRDYPKFYKTNASFYHHNQISDKAVTVSANGINSSLMIQPDSGRYTIHLVNHNYSSATGMTRKGNFTVSLNIDSVPKLIYMKSPDFSESRILKSNYSNGILSISVDTLDYYDVIVLDYVNSSLGSHNPQRKSTFTKNGSLNIIPELKGDRLFVYSNLSVSQKVTITLYSVNGSKVTTILDRVINAGSLTTDVKIANLPASNYIMCINAGKKSVVKNICITK